MCIMLLLVAQRAQQGQVTCLDRTVFTGVHSESTGLRYVAGKNKLRLTTNLALMLELGRVETSMTGNVRVPIGRRVVHSLHLIVG